MHFPVNRIAQAGAMASLDDSEFLDRSIRVVKEGRDQLTGTDENGSESHPSQTNFVLVDLEIPATPIYEAMLPQGVIVRPLGTPGTSHLPANHRWHA